MAQSGERREEGTVLRTEETGWAGPGHFHWSNSYNTGLSLVQLIQYWALIGQRQSLEIFSECYVLL